MTFQPGTEVVTTFDDPDLPEGSVGIVIEVHPDPADGVDVDYPSGVFNVIGSELRSVDCAGEK